MKLKTYARAPGSQEHMSRAQIRVQVRSVDEETGFFSGFLSVFNETDSYGTQFAPGCFARSLQRFAEKGRMPALLWQHDWREVIGRFLKLEETAEGLYFEARLELKTQRGLEAMALLRADPLPALDGMSIGFNEIAWELREGRVVFTEVDLWEGSLVTFPSNDSARVQRARQIEEINTERDLEDFLREAGVSRSISVAVASRFQPKAPRDSAANEQHTEERDALADAARALLHAFQ